MNLKEKLADIWRQLVFHPVAYCLYQKIQKRRVTWEKDDKYNYTIEDGGVRFLIEESQLLTAKAMSLSDVSRLSSS